MNQNSQFFERYHLFSNCYKFNANLQNFMNLCFFLTWQADFKIQMDMQRANKNIQDSLEEEGIHCLS